MGHHCSKRHDAFAICAAATRILALMDQILLFGHQSILKLSHVVNEGNTAEKMPLLPKVLAKIKLFLVIIFTNLVDGSKEEDNIPAV